MGNIGVLARAKESNFGRLDIGPLAQFATINLTDDLLALKECDFMVENGWNVDWLMPFLWSSFPLRKGFVVMKVLILRNS